MFISNGIKPQPIPQHWFGLTNSMRLDGRFWNRVAEKLVKAGHLDFAGIADETVRRAISLVEGEDAGQRRAVMIMRVINNTPPGQRPPPRKVEVEGQPRDGKHRGLGPAPVVLNRGIRDVGAERRRAPPGVFRKRPESR